MIDQEDIELFAKTTGQFYDEHCQLARRGAGIEQWYGHVRRTVIPRYIREVLRAGHPMPASAVASRLVMRAAARALMEYYNQHIKEL